MGETAESPPIVQFDHRLKIEFREITIAPDADLPAFREWDDALGLTKLAASRLTECRKGKNTQHATLDAAILSEVPGQRGQASAISSRPGSLSL